MLPTPQTATQPQPRRLSLSELQNELDIPRQDTRPQLQAEGNAAPDLGGFPGEGPNINAPITEETAAAAGDQIATFIDYISSGACGLISGNDSSKYAIKSAERRDLSNAYAKVAQKYGFPGVNPVFEAVMLTAIIIVPNFRAAFQDRRYNKVKDELAEMKQEIKDLQNESKRIKTEQPAGSSEIGAEKA